MDDIKNETAKNHRIRKCLLRSIGKRKPVSHKKDPAEVVIEGIHEFYVMERKYVTKKEIKGVELSGYSGLRESSEYTYEYWKDLSRYGIPPLSKQIEDELEKSLTAY